MLEGLVVWSSFAVCGLTIVFAGPRLSRYGDAIAEKTGMQRNWIGVILLALVTSLPEVATSTTAAVLDLPDVVFGNVFGSNLFNVLIIGILDIITPRPPLLKRVSKNHVLTSTFGLKMMALALLPLLLYNIPSLGISPIKILGVIDISSLILIFVYIIGMRSIFIQDHLTPEEETKINLPDKYGSISTRMVYVLFALYALMIIAAGIVMSFLADQISGYEIPLFGQRYTIGQSLVGIILLAVVTSLPELMVSIGAVRLGAVDMAVGNVLGSNMFNMLIIGMSDFFYHAGSIINRPTIMDGTRVTGLASHLLTGLAGMIMLGVVTVDIAFQKKRNRRISPSTIVLFLIFILTYLMLFYINFR